MKIELHKMKLAVLSNGYADNGEGGVTGYGGMLNIRPAYQREFVYKPEQQESVVRSVAKGFPINVMYWVAVPGGGGFEVIDGQQRTISLCRYITGDFSVDGRFFHNLKDDEKQSMFDYEMMIYQCTGTHSEKLDWFSTINIAGEKLTKQETLNAVFNGPFVSDARRWFSRSNCPAQSLGGKYMRGNPIRQDYLETALKWISDWKVQQYMSANQTTEDAAELWGHFESVITWVAQTFPLYRKEMKGIDWGTLYRLHGERDLDPGSLERQISDLMADDEVTNKRGVYSFVLDGKERNLNIRGFDTKIKRSVYEQQGGKCAICDGYFGIELMEGDHVQPWSQGGTTTSANCQMICEPCHKNKTRTM